MATGTLALRPVKFSPNWNLKERYVCMCVFKKPWVSQKSFSMGNMHLAKHSLQKESECELRAFNTNTDTPEGQRIK